MLSSFVYYVKLYLHVKLKIIFFIMYWWWWIPPSVKIITTSNKKELFGLISNPLSTSAAFASHCYTFIHQTTSNMPRSACNITHTHIQSHVRPHSTIRKFNQHTHTDMHTHKVSYLILTWIFFWQFFFSIFSISLKSSFFYLMIHV